MFAVPGWAVSNSDIVQQTSKPKTRKGTDPEKASKKRKRDAEFTKDHSVDTRSDAGLVKRTEGNSKKPQNLRNSESEKAQEDNHGTISSQTAQQDGAHPKAKQQKKQKQELNSVLVHKDDQSTEDASVTKRKGEHAQTKNGGFLRTSSTTSVRPAHPPEPPQGSKLTPLQAKMRSKLTSARFRHLNETLYTTSSSDAFALFSNSPELFADYHAGFSQQVKDSWPQNPVDGYIKAVKARGTLSESKLGQGILPLPRRKTGSCTIADLGCGDAPLARGCQSDVKTLKLKFHNYDLHSPNSFVTKADMSNLPLRDGEADVTVFCLSLMGTNWISFVEEAWRILRGDGKGEVWVAEVKSRFGRVIKGRVVDNSVGKRRKKPKSRGQGNANGDDDDEAYHGPEQFAEDDRFPDDQDDETDVTAFVKVFTRRGFQLREGSINKSNKMFVSMIFTKSGIPTVGKYKDLKWNGKQYVNLAEQRPPAAANADDRPPKKFLPKKGSSRDAVEDVSPEEEAKVLKPCVYKIR